MSSNAPLVSIVLPVYNRPIVVNTINSLIQQTYQNLEILIIDNKSTDDTVASIKSIIDPRIRLLINDMNRGQTYSINRGLKEAKGKYIARIDSDDIALPNRIIKQVEYMESHQNCVLCGSWVRTINDDDELGYIIKCCEHNDAIKLSMNLYCPFFHPAVMIRKEALENNNLFYDGDIKIAEDYDLWARLLDYGEGYNIQEVLTYYRQGDNNDSKKHELLMYKESLVIQEREREKIENLAWRQKMKKAIRLELDSKRHCFFSLRLAKTYKGFIKKFKPVCKTDYLITKKQTNIRLYGAIIQTRDNFFSKVVKSFVRKFKHRRKKDA